MSVLRYSPEDRLAIATFPEFPSEDEAALCDSDSCSILVLQEWQTYFVKCYADTVPPCFPRPGTYYNLREFPGNLFEISFRNNVGLTRIGSIPVRVSSKKLSETDFQAILDYIAGKYANLVFSFSTPVGQHFRKGKSGRDIPYVEYLFLKKFLLDSSPNFDGIAALILANPHNRLFREFRSNSIDTISNISPAMLATMFTASGRFAVLGQGNPLCSTACGRALRAGTGRPLFPTEAPEERKYHTVDTNENRFVKHFLESVVRRMARLTTVLQSENGGYLNPDIKLHLAEMNRKIGLFLSDPLWFDVGSMHFIPASSQILQRREGYRQLYRLYALLQLSSQCHFDAYDFKNLVELKDIATLFEYWVFFVIKDILDKNRKIVSAHTIVPDKPLEQYVTEGIQISYEGGVSLWFNKTCPGSPGFDLSQHVSTQPTIRDSYSHNLRPDIMLTKGDKNLIFDAKFKGTGGGFYGVEGEDGSIIRWKDEDIDKMHTYREAIRNVTGAFILYPGENGIIYPAHGSQERYEGVGALPLKPEAGAQPVQEHREYLQHIIMDFIGT